MGQFVARLDSMAFSSPPRPYKFKERLTSQKMSSKNSILPFISIWLHYKTELSARNKAETGIRYEWYAMQRWGANYWDDAYPELGYYLTIIGNKVWR